MFSGISRSFYRTSAWRLALRSTIVFAAGSAAVFWVMYIVVAHTVQARSDSWLMGESETLKQVALTTPRDALYDRIVEEVAELASQEVSYDSHGQHVHGNTVFFAETGAGANKPVWVGPADRSAFLNVLSSVDPSREGPVSIRVPGWSFPFRVVAVRMGAGGRIYLGLHDAAAAALMRRLFFRFALGWFCMVVFGFVVTLLGLRRMLRRVDAITGAAASIRSDDLSTRVPLANHRDEVARLARTFNNMLDRISSSVSQLRTLTDSMAHDLRSPITSVRGRLEIALSLEDRSQSAELVAGAIEQLDRLSEFITTSLDVAEAGSGALRLHLETIDLGEVTRRIVELYAPAFGDNRQQLAVAAASPVPVRMDLSLANRMLSNLIENELRYAGSDSHVRVEVSAAAGLACLSVEDDGPGFPAELLRPDPAGDEAAAIPPVFQRFVKGSGSQGHGLGLAFVNAVALVHGGRVIARNRDNSGGARILLEIPLSSDSQPSSASPSRLAVS